MLNSNAVGGGDFRASLRALYLSSPTYNPTKKNSSLSSLARCNYYIKLYLNPPLLPKNAPLSHFFRGDFSQFSKKPHKTL